ncbi:MAG: family efflux transporter subunit [Chthonomonadaceae bacterium]|nr:family efflux transporter subunit [Chthonomonadaceae bacterium]
MCPMNSRVLLSTTALSLLFSGLGMGCRHEPPPDNPLTPVQTTRVERVAQQEEEVRYSGSVTPYTQVDVAFKVGGYIRSILTLPDGLGHPQLIQAGDRIRAGTVLATVQPEDYAPRVVQASSQVDSALAAILQTQAAENQAQAGGREAEATLLGAHAMQEEAHAGKQLAEEQLSSAQTGKQQAENQREEAQAGVEQAQATLGEVRANLEQARLDFQRVEALYQSGSATKPQYDADKARLDATGARMQATQKQIRAAQSRLAQAETQVTLAQTQIEQAQTRVRASQAKLDQASAQVQVGLARLDAAHAQIATAQAQMRAAGATRKGAAAQLTSARVPYDDTLLRAPLSGVVVGRKIEIGSLVAPGTAGFTIADTARVKVVFGVPDYQARTLRVGLPARVEVETLQSRPLTGRISSISPAADPKTRVFTIEVTVPNQGGQLKIGMIATLALAGERTSPKMAAVPLAAILRSPHTSDGYAVVVVSEENGRAVAHYRTITMGVIYGNQVAVTGVKEGEQIVASSPTMVREGETVQCLAAKEDAPHGTQN